VRGAYRRLRLGGGEEVPRRKFEKHKGVGRRGHLQISASRRRTKQPLVQEVAARKKR